MEASILGLSFLSSSFSPFPPLPSPSFLLPFLPSSFPWFPLPFSSAFIPLYSPGNLISSKHLFLPGLHWGLSRCNGNQDTGSETISQLHLLGACHPSPLATTGVLVPWDDKSFSVDPHLCSCTQSELNICEGFSDLIHGFRQALPGGDVDKGSFQLMWVISLIPARRSE